MNETVTTSSCEALKIHIFNSDGLNISNMQFLGSKYSSEYIYFSLTDIC